MPLLQQRSVDREYYHWHHAQKQQGSPKRHARYEDVQCRCSQDQRFPSSHGMALGKWHNRTIHLFSTIHQVRKTCLYNNNLGITVIVKEVVMKVGTKMTIAFTVVITITMMTPIKLAMSRKCYDKDLTRIPWALEPVTSFAAQIVTNTERSLAKYLVLPFVSVGFSCLMLYWYEEQNLWHPKHTSNESMPSPTTSIRWPSQTTVYLTIWIQGGRLDNHSR